MAKTRKAKGRSQSGPSSNPPDSTMCCFCQQKKLKMVIVQLRDSNYKLPACMECRRSHDGQWRYPR